ncbi:hypothetical protein J6590_053356, partial [Homalodisca vitripennis]
VKSTINELKTLMNTYWMLHDAVHQANVFYGDQLMAVISSSFIHVTIRSYYFFLYVRNGNMISVTSESIWVLSHVCYLVVLKKINPGAVSAQDASKEHKNSRALLHVTPSQTIVYTN